MILLTPNPRDPNTSIWNIGIRKFWDLEVDLNPDRFREDFEFLLVIFRGNINFPAVLSLQIHILMQIGAKITIKVVPIPKLVFFWNYRLFCWRNREIQLFFHTKQGFPMFFAACHSKSPAAMEFPDRIRICPGKKTRIPIRGEKIFKTTFAVQKIFFCTFWDFSGRILGFNVVSFRQTPKIAIFKIRKNNFLNQNFPQITIKVHIIAKLGFFSVSRVFWRQKRAIFTVLGPSSTWKGTKIFHMFGIGHMIFRTIQAQWFGFSNSVAPTWAKSSAPSLWETQWKSGGSPFSGRILDL